MYTVLGTGHRTQYIGYVLGYVYCIGHRTSVGRCDNVVEFAGDAAVAAVFNHHAGKEDEKCGHLKCARTKIDVSSTDK